MWRWIQPLCWVAALSLLLAAPVFAQKKQKPPATAAKKKPAAQQTQATQPAAATPAPQARSIPPDRRFTDKPHLREDWIYRQRTFPLKSIPFGIRQKAIRRMGEMRRAERERGFVQAPGAASAINANTMTWTPIGPQPSNSDSPFFGPIFGVTSGRIGALAVNPLNPDVAYLGGAQGGVWKTTDSGASWTPLADFEASLAVGSIALDTTTCNATGCQTIYVGTGEQTFSGVSYYGAGVLKSTDGGMMWTQLGQSVFVGPFGSGFFPGGGARIGSLVISPQNSNKLLAGVQINTGTDTGPLTPGVFCSDDGGVNWTNVLPGAVATEVLYHPTDGSIAYAALGRLVTDAQNGVYRSNNANLPCPQITWTRVLGIPTTEGLVPQARIGRTEIAIAPSAPNTLYASIGDADVASATLHTPNEMFRTTDGGTTWTPLANTPDFCSPQCSYDQVIRVHPNNSNVVYAGGSAAVNQAGTAFIFLIRTTDGGATWSSIVGTSLPIPHVDQHAMAFGFSGATATRLYIGNDGGVWSADVTNPTGTINWVNRNDTLGLTQHYPALSIHPSNESIGLVGSQDNDTHRYTGSLTWQQIGNICDGGWSVIDPFVPSTWYATCQFTFIVKSVQDGIVGTFDQFADNGIDFGDPVEFIAPFIADPNVPDRLYFGTFRVWQTNNGGRSWQAISPDVSGGSVLETIAVAPSDSNIVYAGSASGTVQRTVNAGAGTGAAWSDVTGTGLPPRFVTQIAVHPMLPDTVYVTFSGFGSCAACDGRGHVFRSTTGGVAWLDISGVGMGALPDTPVNDIVVDPLDATGNTLYIGTDVGVFFTTDGGVTWSTLMTGLPNVAVFSLKLHPASRILRAATHGRSVWDLQLPGLPAFHLRSISPVTTATGSGGAMLVVIGAGFTPSSVVEFNGMPLVTTQDATNPATQLSPTIPASLVTVAGVAQIRVNDPGQGVSNALAFTVTGPPPFLTAVNPNSVMEGSGDTVVTLLGAQFSPNSIVLYARTQNNVRVVTDLPTVFLTSSQLQATIPASIVAQGDIDDISVFRPAPGGGESNAVTFTVISPPPPNDNFANAIVITGNSFSDTQNNTGATTEANDPNPGSIAACPGAGRNRSIWYRYTPTANVTAVVDTGGSSYDTVLSVWTGAALGSLTAVACNDDGIAPAGASILSLNLTANTTYHFMITGFGADDGGTTEFNFVIPPPNDNFVNATVVGAVPFTDMVNSMLATTQASDPTPTCVGSRANSIWYRYTASANGTVTADTFGSNYDTVLSVFTGAPGTFAPVACNDDAMGLQSQLTFAAAANTTHHFMVTDFSSGGGATVFHITAAPAPAPDISLSSAQGTLTVTRGQSASTMISVSAFAGFNGSVTLACSGAPSLATCTANPASVMPGAMPASSTLTITTTAGSTASPAAAGPAAPLPGLAWFMAFAFGFGLLLALRRSRRLRFAGGVALVFVLLLLALQVACGGGGDGGGGNPPAPQPGTPPGTYTITVTGTSGTLSRSTTLTLTVN
jgi:photosystem II stability/assembly factor-like uncharacterized protein